MRMLRACKVGPCLLVAREERVFFFLGQVVCSFSDLLMTALLHNQCDYLCSKFFLLVKMSEKTKLTIFQVVP